MTALEYMPPFPVADAKDIGVQKGYRKTAWHQTHEMGKQGYYTAPGSQEKVEIGFAAAVRGTKKFHGDADAQKTHWKAFKNKFDTPAEVVVVKGDCLKAAIELTKQGLNPMVMDAASRAHFGGGYKGGSRAQEEELCRRTTLAFAVDPSLKYQKDRSLYPIAPVDAIYVPQVTIFRSDFGDRYTCLDQPVMCGVGIVAAHSRPPLKSSAAGGGEEMMVLDEPYATETESMLRTFFQMGLENGHDALVVIPLGCGAFQNPALHVSQMMMKVVEEYRFAYKSIVFSIIDDHNSAHAYNPLGNFLPFALHVASLPDGKVFRDVFRSSEIDMEELEAEKQHLLQSRSPHA